MANAHSEKGTACSQLIMPYNKIIQNLGAPWSSGPWGPGPICGPVGNPPLNVAYANPAATILASAMCLYKNNIAAHLCVYKQPHLVIARE